MKKILSFMLSFTVGVSLFALDIFSYVPITGNVKNYTQIDYTITPKFGNYFRTPNYKTVSICNAANKAVEITELTPRDSLITKTVNTYDVKGNLINQVVTDSEEKLLWKTVNTYKDDKQVDSSEYGVGDVLKAKTIYTYEGNLLVDETCYNSDGLLSWKIINKYDDLGRKTVVSQYENDGNLDERYTYEYLEDGKIKTRTYYDGITSKTISNTFKYSNTGALTDVITYDENKKITKRVVLKYDSVGNINKISEYDVLDKFDTVVNELVSMIDYTYQY